MRFDVAAAERKTWWRNFETPRPASILLAGQEGTGVATATCASRRATVTIALDPPTDGTA